MLSCEEGLVVSAESGGRAREMKNSAIDCASVVGEFPACFVQECENVLCFGHAGAEAEEDWVA